MMTMRSVFQAYVNYSWLTAVRCIVLAFAATLLIACNDDDDFPSKPGQQAWKAEVVEGSSLDDEGRVTFARQGSYERLTINIAGYDAATDGLICMSSDADWLILSTDTLASDNNLVIITQTNDTDRRRTAHIVFTASARPDKSTSIEVEQLSAADADTNGEDARMQLYVGYGYDIYAELDNPMSVRTKRPIIDLEVLRSSEWVYGFEAIHDSRLAQFDVEVYASTSIEELSNIMTRSASGTDVDILGCLETCKRLGDAAGSDISLNEQNLGYGKMTKTVYARVLDKGALTFLRREDDGGTWSNRLGLTDEFMNDLATIRQLSGTKRSEKVTKVLLEYGTHLIIQADLGGKVDYAFTMNKQSSFNVDTEADEETRYTLGQLTKGDRTSGLKEVSSKKNGSASIQISGGSQESRKLLANDIKKLDQQGQIPPEHMQQWMASISYSDALAADRNLEVVHFELMPLWDLVPQDLRLDFLDATLKLAKRSDFQLPASFLGTDIYELSPQKERTLFNFNTTTENNSLCRLLYFENEPVLQVCSEYVPKIRTDQRVIIAYPIYKQHIRMNQGLFIGDGIHQPAYVGFSGSDCYVNPIDSLPPGSLIEKFWYVNGNLLLKNPSRESSLTGKNRSVQEDFLYLYGNDDHYTASRRHPIVKIGSKFWTRRDINHHMYFASSYTGPSADWMEDGILYTRFQWEPNNIFMGFNSWTWGYAPNTYFEGHPNTKWYLPFDTDVNQLYAYLGFNPKALFKGQVSGWDAQFNGYYGQSDLLNENRLFPGGQREMHYKTELNVISSRNATSERSACVMILHPDYRIEIIDDTSYRNSYRYEWRNNFYPVRAIRGYMFEYPTLTTIKKNQK